MKARGWAAATLILGLATLAAAYALGAHDAVRAVYERAELTPAVSQFQRADSLADVALVFGAPPDPARIAAMDAVNARDLWFFVPAYALYLSAAALMLGGVRRRWSWAAIAFALAGAGADAVETWKQLALTAHIADPAPYLPIAPWYWLKYFALGLNGAAMATLAVLGAPRRWVLAVLGLAPLFAVAGAYLGLFNPNNLSSVFAVLWVWLLAVAVMSTLRAKGASP
jgi:hypothetical protein